MVFRNLQGRRRWRGNQKKKMFISFSFTGSKEPESRTAVTPPAFCISGHFEGILNSFLSSFQESQSWALSVFFHFFNNKK